MHLKQINIAGFKSFATKTKIDFETGITGIVGPNGSGKSNILDAVKWVLGEQSIKSLRATDSMTDVIFSGSKSRKAASMASVNLIFDNSDKHLATSYEEISIKRTIYKTGDNEYYLNGEKCRLKDITELFLDSGTSKNAFNVISQGKVQEILSNKPEERRIIFEEAAGVLKYKKRKEEALRKLERTQKNMIRISDITNELEKQLEPLRKQALKARKYVSLKENLKKVEIALIATDISTINKEYKNRLLKINNLKEEIENLTVSSSKEESELVSKKTELANMDRELYKLNQDLIKTISKKEQLNSQKNIIIERQKFEVDDQKKHNQLIILKEEKHKIENNLRTFKSEIEELKETLENTNLKLKNEFNEEKNKRKEKTQLQSEIEEKTKRKSSLMYKIENLKNSIENNSSMSYSVKNVLNNPRLTGIHGVIGKLIETEEKYALAIDMSLGISREFIVVDNKFAAEKAIEYLKENKLGRATFFPIDTIYGRSVDQATIKNIQNTPGFVGIASDLVKYDSEYEKIITNQLGRIIIAKDLESANKISKKANHKYKIVSLEGDVVNIGGSLTGGSVKRKAGMMKEKYELENLVKEYSHIKQEIKISENKILNFNKKVDEIEAKIRIIAKEKNRLEDQLEIKIENLDSADKKLESIQLDLKSFSDDEENDLTKEEEKIIKDFYEEEENQKNLERKIDNLSETKEQIQEEITNFEKIIRKENSEYSKKQNELKEKEIKNSRMEFKLDSLLETLNEEYSLTYDHAKEKYELEIEVKLAREKVNNLKKEIKTLGDVNKASIEEFERVEKRYSFLNSQLEDLRKAKATLLEIIEEMDAIMKEQFSKTFQQIKEQFKITFTDLFDGGKATLSMTDPYNELETGIEIEASPPGKKLKSISLLSGGEKSLTAIALLFSILKVSPVPYCILDEVEAALDEVNVDNFGRYLKTFKKQTQFIIITHKKKTMEFVDVLYGITMAESGVSKLVSVKLEEAEKYIQK